MGKHGGGSPLTSSSSLWASKAVHSRSDLSSTLFKMFCAQAAGRVNLGSGLRPLSAPHLARAAPSPLRAKQPVVAATPTHSPTR